MKKARFLSLLLAAVMTASAMPVFATTASAAENLITSGTLTASGATSTLDASEDGYISVGGRTNRENSLQYQYNFKYGTRYRVSFAGRQSVPSNQNYSFRVKTATQGSIEFQSWKKQSYAEAAVGKDILVPNGHHWLSGESISNKNIAVNDKWKADYPTGSTKPAEAVFNTYKLVSDNIAQGTMSKDCAWGNYSFTYQFMDKAEGGADTVTDRLSIYAGTNSIFTQAFDIDDFKLEEYNASTDTWTQVAFYDFNTSAPIGEGVGKFRASWGTNVGTNNSTHKIISTLTGETEYTRIAAASGNTTATYTPAAAVVLTPGIYEISADLRYAYSNGIAAPDNSFNVTAKATIDGAPTELASVKVVNGWTKVGGSIMVLEDTTVSDITFTANAAQTMDIKNIEITALSTFDHLALDVLGTAVTPAMTESGSNIVLTYSVENDALTNGIYAITAASNDGATGTYAVNVAYTLSNGSKVTKNVSFDVANETALAYVTLADGVTVDKVTITADGGALAAFKPAIKFVEGFKSEVSTDGSVAIYDIPEEALVLSENATLDIDRYETFDEGNKYIRLYDRNNNWAGFGMNFSSLAIGSDKEYFLEFDVRAATDVTNLGKSLFGFQVPNVGRLTSLVYYANDVKSTDGFTYNMTSDEWTHFNVSFKQDAYTLDKLKVMNLIGRYGWDESNPFDFDNFGVYYMDGSEKVYIYEEDFQDATVGTLSGDIAAYFSAFTDNGKWKGTVAVEEDQVYYTTDSTTISYEFAEGEVTLERGIYTLNAEFADPEYDFSKSKRVSATNNAIADDGNNFDVTATLTLSDGTEYTDTFTATTQWKSPEIGFAVFEASDVYVESVAFTVAADAEYIIRGFNVARVPLDEILDLDDDNLLDGVNASYTGIVENVVMDTEGYLYTPARASGGDDNYVTITIDEKPEVGTTYYISFDMRASAGYPNHHTRLKANFATVEAANMNSGMKYVVPNANAQIGTVTGTAADPDNHYCSVCPGSAWGYYEGTFTPQEGTTANNIVLSFGRGPGAYLNPFDTDNIKVWYMDGTEEVVIYENDFNTEGDIHGITSTVAIEQPIATSHTVLTPVEGNYATVVYDVSDLDYTDGIYTFSAEVMTGETGATGEAKVIYTLSDGTTKKSDAYALDNNYTAVAGVVSVMDGVTIESIKLETDVDGVIKYRYVDLSFVEFETVVTEDEENTLNNAVIKVDGATQNVIVEDNPNGYLYVGERAFGTTNFLTIDLGTKSTVGTKYYVTMLVKTADGSSTAIRPSVNFGIKEALAVADGGVFVDGMGTENGMNGNYVVPSATNELSMSWSVTSVAEGSKNFPIYYIDANATTLAGEFTANAATSMKLVINRGPNSAYTQPLIIDDIEVWYMNGDNKMVVYSNDFNVNGSDAGITALADLYVTVPRSRTEYVPTSAESPVVVDIEPNISEEQLVDGAYVFVVDMKTSDPAVASAEVLVTYTFENGDTYSEYHEITGEWNPIILTRALTKDNPVVNVTIRMDNPVAFEMSNPKLVLRDHKHEGLPNFGIVMMLLYKKSGGVKKVVEEVEFIKDGKLDNEPIIHNEAVPKTVTVDDAGFWAKQAAANPTTVTYVKEGSNGFVRIKDLDAGQRGIWYNTGIELEPGTYTFKVDVRVSEQPGETNYTAYNWRDASKGSMMMRTILQNPANVGSGNYAAFDPVDKDTAMNKDGAVTSTQYLVTREWTTLTDVVVLEQPTVVIFKIGGGMSGNPDAHGYDIDNLSLVGTKTYYKQNGVIVENIEDLPEEFTKVEETPEVAGNLIINGDFDEQPTVAAGDKYDETKANTWFQNDGTGYKKDHTGKDITDEPQIPINHRITWTDGYLTFSGRTNNLRNFWYNSGITVEPGTYKLTIDFKTAKEGETSSIRCAVDKLFNPTVNDALAIDNNWKTMTIGFTASAATPIKLTFWGGPGASYIQDFCVDNIILQKIG